MSRRALIVTLSLWGCAHPPAPGESLDAEDAGFDSRALTIDLGADMGFDSTLEAGIDDAMVPALDLDEGIDAGSRDVGLDEPDSLGEALDAGFGLCRVGAREGRCIDVSLCGAGFRAVPGHCPGPAAIQCCVPARDGEDCDPARLRPQEIPPAPQAADPACPAEMVPIDTFCVDRYEAALVVNGEGWSPYHNPGEMPAVAVSRAGLVPQGYINGHQAAAACERAGKRLCSDREWARACGGEEAWTYPYGPERVAGRCNDARAVHPAVERFPDAANPFSLIQDACINQLPESLVPAGARVDCVTPEGVHDLMGNLHEWTSAQSGTFRGGFYVDTVRNGEGCLYATTAHDRHHWDYSTGFRCCADLR